MAKTKNETVVAKLKSVTAEIAKLDDAVLSAEHAVKVAQEKVGKINAERSGLWSVAEILVNELED